MPARRETDQMTKPGYADMREHVARLDAAGLLYRIDAPVDKDC